MNLILWGISLTVLTIALLLVAITHARTMTHQRAAQPCEDVHDMMPGEVCTCGYTATEDTT